MDKKPLQINRQNVRNFVERHADEIIDLTERGENVNQRILDQSDELEKMTSKMSDEDAAKFLNMYTEEMEARSMDILNNASYKINNMIRFAGVIIVVISFIFAFKSCSV